MTPHYNCRFVIYGHSSNKGAFQEEGEASTLRREAESFDEEALRRKFTQDALHAFHSITQHKKNPKYKDVTDLRVSLGEIEIR